MRPLRARLQELEAERARAAREQLDLARGLRALLLQPADLRHLRLRLLRLVLLGAEALDEALEPRDVDRDAVGGLLRVLARCAFSSRHACQGPAKNVARPADELERRVRDRLEEPAVVRDEDHAGVERLQLALQPFEARDVEVVRRLVEQDQVGVAAERARQRGARQLAARERGERPVEVDLGEAEAAHDGVRALAPRVAARRARAAPAPRRSARSVAASCSPAPIASSRRRSSSSVAIRSRAPERTYSRSDRRAVERRSLVVQRDARALLEGELAAVELGLARQQPEQGRLAGAVRARRARRGRGARP